MPAVKGRKKTTRRSTKAKTSKASKSKRRSSAGFSFRDWWSNLSSSLMTYAVAGLVCAALLAVLMLFAGGYMVNVGDRLNRLTASVARSVGFTVTRVSVSGAANVTDREVMMALRDPAYGSVLGQSLLHVDAESARLRIEELGWVDVAAVQKLWPDTIHVSIIERSPVALWQDGTEAVHLIDRTGTIMGRATLTDYTNLPVVADAATPAEAGTLLGALAARPVLYGRVAAIQSVSGRRFDIRFRNDFTARLPEAPYDEALNRLDELGAGTGRLAASLEYLDLRNDEWAYLKPKEG